MECFDFCDYLFENEMFLYFIFRRELPTLLHFIKKLSNAGTHTTNFIVTKTTVVLSVLTFFGWRRLSRNGRGPAV